MFFHPKNLKIEKDNPWFKPWFNILLHTQSIVCATVDSQCLQNLKYNFASNIHYTSFIANEKKEYPFVPLFLCLPSPVHVVLIVLVCSRHFLWPQIRLETWPRLAVDSPNRTARQHRSVIIGKTGKTGKSSKTGKTLKTRKTGKAI